MAELTINGESLGSVSVDALAEYLAGLASVPRAEVWLSHPEGPSVSLLKSQDRALLMYLRAEGDSGMTSRAKDLPSGEAALEFTLANGQKDEYPAAWTISFEDARRAMEYFWFAKAPAPFVTWHDDYVRAG